MSPILFEDTRQQVNKHDEKHHYFDEHGIKLIRTKVYVGDYTLPTDQKICIDSKKGLPEVSNNVCGKDHLRFRKDCQNAEEVGIRYIVLVEEDSIGDDGRHIDTLSDVQHWVNPRLEKNPTATKGITLMRAMQTMERKYGVQFMFCRSSDAGRIIWNILRLSNEERE